eukprot:COSAG02_NODE_266_length_26580_cov_9.209207_17_plen_86_part_00
MSVVQVAQYLIDAPHKLPWCHGVVFLDEDDKKMILVRATGRVQELATCGIKSASRFAFYDQVHTTGDFERRSTTLELISVYWKPL